MPAAPLLVLLLAQATDFQAEGLKALEAQRYDIAAELFAKAVAQDPKDYAAHFHLALAYSLGGKGGAAISEYKTTLELKPGLYEAELNLGVLLLRQKDAAGAAPYLKSAADKKRKEFRPNFYLAEALLAEGQAEAAAAAYQTALAIDPNAADADLGLGRALARLGKLSEAAPHFRSSPLELASFYEAAKQPMEAVAIYARFPENPGAQERAGALLLDAGRAQDAIPFLERAVEKSPTAANRVALGRAYIENKQPDRGLPLIEHAVQAEPGNYDLRMHYGRTLRDQRKFSGAAPQFLAAAQLKPDSVEAWSELAGALILAENHAPALAALDRVKALGGETSAHFFFRAIVLDKLRQYPQALENYEKFLATSNGKSPDEEFKARQRVRIIRKELSKR